MRKHWLMTALLIPIFVLAACARATQPAPTVTPTSTTEPTLAPSPIITSTQPTPTHEVTASQTPSSGLITVNNASDLNIAKSLVLPVDPSAVIWAQDSITIAVTAYKDVLLINLSDMSIIKHVTLPENDILLDFSSDGHSLATSTTDFKTITITNILSGEVTQTIDPGVQFVSASFSPDGSQLVVGTIDQWAGLIFDVASGKLLETATGFQTAAPVYNIHFGQDGKSVVWVARGSIQVETIATQILGADIGHEDFITAWSLSHTGDLLTTSAGGTLNGEYSPLLHFWNPINGSEISKLPLTDSAISLAFSPDDTLLAASAGDNIIVWDVASQTQVFIDPAHLGGACDARFSPDGAMLASVGADRVLNIWISQ